MPAVGLHPLTGRSLHLMLRFDGQELSQATGYVVGRGNRRYLVTCYHVLAGRSPGTARSVPTSPAAGIPNQVVIAHHMSGRVDGFDLRVEALFDSRGEDLVLRLADPEVDVAALPITNADGVDLLPVEDILWAREDVRVHPSEDVSIVGFPFGLAVDGRFPIWKTGHVASDIDLAYQGLPCFLVDAATRGGMSGAPVYAIRSVWHNAAGALFSSTTWKNRFMGTYSGRLHVPAEFQDCLSPPDCDALKGLGSDIGMVWRADLLERLLPA